MTRLSLTTAIALSLFATQASAGSWLKDDKPCGAKCPAVKANTFVQSPFIHQYLGDANQGQLVYQSRSQTVIGNSVYNSTFRMYRED